MIQIVPKQQTSAGELSSVSLIEANTAQEISLGSEAISFGNLLASLKSAYPEGKPSNEGRMRIQTLQECE